MIKTPQQAIEVQARRRAAGLKGRSKAVRRWFKRTYGQAVEAHGGPIKVPFSAGGEPGRRFMFEVDLRRHLDGDFTGCRSFDEVHDPEWWNLARTQSVNRAQRHTQTPVIHEINIPTEDEIKRVLGNKQAIVMEISRGPE